MYTPKITNKSDAGQAAQLKHTAPKTAAPGAVKAHAQVQQQRSLSAFFAAAGLPADKHSASILSFARFFSLPIKPDLMADIRRQGLFAKPAAAIPAAAQASQAALQSMHAAQTSPASQASMQAAQTAHVVLSKEALLLAAAAAEVKGVHFEPQALEAYALTIEPDSLKKRYTEHNDHGKRDKNQKQSDDEKTEKTASVAAGAPGIKETAMETEKYHIMLSILNNLRGKNGQRWIVLPFDISDNGRDFRVSLRIMLEKDSRVSHFALDIAEASDTEKRWIFVLDEEYKTIPSITVYLRPEYSAKEIKTLKRNLSIFMDIPQERIKLINSPIENESILTESLSGGDFQAIDEEA